MIEENDPMNSSNPGNYFNPYCQIANIGPLSGQFQQQQQIGFSMMENANFNSMLNEGQHGSQQQQQPLAPVQFMSPSLNPILFNHDGSSVVGSKETNNTYFELSNAVIPKLGHSSN